MMMGLLRVHSQDLHEHIAQEIGECLESGLYTDLAIRCAEGQTLHAHKLVLSAVSPYIQMLLENNEWEEIQSIEMSHVSFEEMQMLLEVVYNGVVEATIEDLRKLILLAHRLYITIPLSNELMRGLDLKLPTRPAFRKPLVTFNGRGASPPKMPPIKLGNAFSLGASHHMRDNNYFGGMVLDPKRQRLNIDPSTMTAVLAHSQNNEHVCPICNSKYSNVGNFKQHMKTHDNEELREQRNAILSEMIATCFNPQTSLYTCHVCNSNYNHSGNFKQHLLKHERESGSISATLMAQTGSNPHLTNVLQSAMADRVDSGDKPTVTQYQYQCEHCDRSFKHPGNYKQHLASHIKNTKFEPAISNTIQKVNAMFGQAQQQQQQQKASTSNDTMQMVACPECHLEFPGIDLLQAHISVSHKHLDVKLPNVDGEVSNGGDSSDGGRPSWQLPLDDSQLELYKCTVCSKGFQKMSKLTAHMKIHRAPEEHYNHPCDICGKKFTRPQHVARHKMLHTGERPFKCPKCPRQFTREDKLRHHLSESECGGGENGNAVGSSQFGSLWGSNGDDDMLDMSGIYSNDNSNGANGSYQEEEEREQDDEMSQNMYVTSEASNDSTSNLQQQATA